MSDDHPTHVTGTEARGAEKPRVTRYVLSISLALIVVVFALLLFFSR